MVSISGSRPEKWSACQWEIKIFEIFSGEIFCFCRPSWQDSPQSKRKISAGRRKAKAGCILLAVGIEEPVPRKKISSGVGMEILGM